MKIYLSKTNAIKKVEIAIVKMEELKFSGYERWHVTDIIEKLNSLKSKIKED